MSEIGSNQAENKGNTPIQCAITTEDECVKPSHNNATAENVSSHAAAKESDVTDDDGLDTSRNVLTPTQIGTNNSPQKVKRRSGTRTKHRAGRVKKRRWKPYSKLTWSEKKALEERDARRANRIREQLSASGLVLAPNNTTQFLMNDHDIQEPDYGNVQNRHKHRDRNHQDDSSDEYYSFSDDEEYIYQQFKEDYESYHDQYLNSLSQEELVSQFVELEDQIEVIEKKLAVLRQERKLLGCDALDPDAEMEKIQVFREEIRKITIENEKLEKCNRELNSLLGYS